MPTLHKNFIGS